MYRSREISFDYKFLRWLEKQNEAVRERAILELLLIKNHVEEDPFIYIDYCWGVGREHAEELLLEIFRRMPELREKYAYLWNAHERLLIKKLKEKFQKEGRNMDDMEFAEKIDRLREKGAEYDRALAEILGLSSEEARKEIEDITRRAGWRLSDLYRRLQIRGYIKYTEEKREIDEIGEILVVGAEEEWDEATQVFIREIKKILEYFIASRGVFPVPKLDARRLVFEYARRQFLEEIPLKHLKEEEKPVIFILLDISGSVANFRPHALRIAQELSPVSKVYVYYFWNSPYYYKLYEDFEEETLMNPVSVSQVLKTARRSPVSIAVWIGDAWMAANELAIGWEGIVDICTSEHIISVWLNPYFDEPRVRESASCEDIMEVVEMFPFSVKGVLDAISFIRKKIKERYGI